MTNLHYLRSHFAWLLFYIFLGCLLTANCFAYLDPDFGWHLRVGEAIALSKSVPHDQAYMWSLIGKNWVDHEWLSNLSIYGLWKIDGYTAVASFFILIPLLSLIILNYYVFKNYLRTNQERFIFAIIETFAVFACLPHFGVRVQEFTFLALLLLFIIIDICRRNLNAQAALWLIPLLYIWACLHGGFLIGVAIIIGWLFYETIIYLFPKIKKIIAEESLSKKQLHIVIVVSLISIAVTFITPYGLQLYSFLSDYGINRYYLSHIQEWRTPYSAPFRYDQITYSLLCITLALGSWFSLKQRPALWKGGILLLLLALASRSIRHFPLWAIGSLLFLIPTIISSAFKNIKIPYKQIIIYLTIITLICLSTVFILATRPTKTPFQSYCKDYPCGALIFLNKHPEYSDLKMFNDYGWGGFLIGASPQKQLFIDGRLPQYSFKTHTILEEYSSFFQNNQTGKKLDEYGIDLVIFKAKEPDYQPDFIERYIFGKTPSARTNPLLVYLNASAKWKLVYQDTISRLYARIK